MSIRWSYLSYPLVFPSIVIRLEGSPIAEPKVPGYCDYVAILTTISKKYILISGISKILWEYRGENNKSSDHMALT